VRKNGLWAATGLICVVAVVALAGEQVGARQISSTEPGKFPELPSADASSLEVDSKPPGPAHQVASLSIQIRTRRDADRVAVKALVQKLSEQAEAQRAALAETEEALKAAHALEDEISGQPTSGGPRIGDHQMELSPLPSPTTH
jgi:hypothetical protein